MDQTTRGGDRDGRIACSRHPAPGPAWHAATMIGARTRNDDGFAVRQGTSHEHGRDNPIAVVCDGAGGAAGGEVARTAARAFVDRYIAAANHRRDGLPASPGGRAYDAAMVANDAAGGIVERAMSRNPDGPAGQRPGTTLSAAVVDEDGLYWITIGNSPVLMVHAQGRALREIGERHVLDATGEAGSRIDGGRIQAATTPAGATALNDGDGVIVATKGLDEVPPERIVEISMWHDPADVPGALLKAVEDARGGLADTTTIVYLRRDAYERVTPKGMLVGVRTPEGVELSIDGTAVPPDRHDTTSWNGHAAETCRMLADRGVVPASAGPEWLARRLFDGVRWNSWRVPLERIGRAAARDFGDAPDRR